MFDGQPVSQVSDRARRIDGDLPFTAEQVRQLSVEPNLQRSILLWEQPSVGVSAELAVRSTQPGGPYG
ncbi:hypothetical protein H9L15_12640 [Sphingomonas daechungensis]|uniref:Uncharacterized protein n=1 Tax=Sphingomonas daechungensis TaxID=1176646 RepID=A0ABX6T0D7_9SPHN|nr:hypothetical protein [Sphingomonas daechungensis]QNP42884.1 hypothetical protein H9L15_12640 [Sphingomonas daechungensis]